MARGVEGRSTGLCACVGARGWSGGVAAPRPCPAAPALPGTCFLQPARLRDPETPAWLLSPRSCRAGPVWCLAQLSSALLRRQDPLPRLPGVSRAPGPHHLPGSMRWGWGGQPGAVGVMPPMRGGSKVGL